MEVDRKAVTEGWTNGLRQDRLAILSQMWKGIRKDEQMWKGIRKDEQMWS